MLVIKACWQSSLRHDLPVACFRGKVLPSRQYGQTRFDAGLVASEPFLVFLGVLQEDGDGVRAVAVLYEVIDLTGQGFKSVRLEQRSDGSKGVTFGSLKKLFVLAGVLP